MFSLPGIRNSLPGVPQIGILMDFGWITVNIVVFPLVLAGFAALFVFGRAQQARTA
jgi:hypothetical protein